MDEQSKANDENIWNKSCLEYRLQNNTILVESTPFNCTNSIEKILIVLLSLPYFGLGIFYYLYKVNKEIQADSLLQNLATRIRRYRRETMTLGYFRKAQPIKVEKLLMN